MALWWFLYSNKTTLISQFILLPSFCPLTISKVLLVMLHSWRQEQKGSEHHAERSFVQNKRSTSLGQLLLHGEDSGVNGNDLGHAWDNTFLIKLADNPRSWQAAFWPRSCGCGASIPFCCSRVLLGQFAGAGGHHQRPSAFRRVRAPKAQPCC